MDRQERNAEIAKRISKDWLDLMQSAAITGAIVYAALASGKWYLLLIALVSVVACWVYASAILSPLLSFFRKIRSRNMLMWRLTYAASLLCTGALVFFSYLVVDVTVRALERCG